MKTDAARAQLRDHRNRVRKFVIQTKVGKPCALCGGHYNTWQMQYDHIDFRTKKIRMSRTDSFEGAKRELAKCRLLCANCHANVTYENRYIYQGVSPEKIENQLELGWNLAKLSETK